MTKATLTALSYRQKRERRMNVRKIFTMTALIVMGLVLSGCYTTGLSLRERGRFNYSNFIYGLYGGPEVARRTEKKVSKPVKLAVAQVGENTPPKVMLDRLRAEQHLISLVETIPAGGVEPTYYDRNDKELDKNEFQKKMLRMRQLAGDLGAGYLFIFGGSADYGYTPNMLQLLDITFIGAYIFPSVKHMAEGRASGALIDVEDGRVLFVADAEAKLKKLTPSYFNYYDGNDEILAQLRDKLVDQLAVAFIEKLGTAN